MKTLKIDTPTLQRVLNEGATYPDWNLFKDRVKESFRPIGEDSDVPMDPGPINGPVLEDLIVSALVSLAGCPAKDLVSRFWERLKRLSSLQTPGGGYVEVERLAKLVDPFSSLRLTREAVLKEKNEVAYVEPGKRKKKYHTGRIRYFLEHPDEIARHPVDLDFIYQGYTPVRADLADGHHRLAAAILLGEKLIPIEFSGHMDIYYWLIGFGPIEVVPYGLA